MTLTTPWDKAALIAELKAKGVADAEKLAQGVLDTVLDWSVASCALEASVGKTIYGIGAMLLPEIKKQVDDLLAAAAAKV